MQQEVIPLLVKAKHPPRILLSGNYSADQEPAPLLHEIAD
jgi:hypothetical protein